MIIYMISHEEFLNRLRTNRYNNSTAAKRATGRVKMSKVQKSDIGAVIDKHFGGAEPTRAAKAEKAPRAAKAAPAKRASTKGKPRLVSGKQWLSRLRKGKYADAQSARDAVSKFSHWTSAELDRANELIEQWAADPNFIRTTNFSPRKPKEVPSVSESAIQGTVSEALKTGKAQVKLQQLLNAAVIADHLSAGLSSLESSVPGGVEHVAVQLASTIERLSHELALCSSVLFEGPTVNLAAPETPPPSSNGKATDNEKASWEAPQAHA